LQKIAVNHEIEEVVEIEVNWKIEEEHKIEEVVKIVVNCKIEEEVIGHFGGFPPNLWWILVNSSSISSSGLYVLRTFSQIFFGGFLHSIFGLHF
jgi:hypothetical protein